MFTKNDLSGDRLPLTLDGVTAQKMKFSIKDFFSKCDQIRSFCAVASTSSAQSINIFPLKFV